MGFRHVVGSGLRAVIGPERTRGLRRTERRFRNSVAGRIAMPAPAPAKPAAKAGSGRVPSDPFVPHPKPPMSRHAFLRGLHEVLQPRTYLEIGVADGASLGVVRCRSIGVDPAFHVDHEIETDVQLIRSTSDAFFARENPVAHFDGVPVDLAFIDGMHLSEYALRDFIGVEPFLASTGVVLFDDILPRNPLEAARDRRTYAWTGDVYKAVELLAEHRKDLIVVLVNTGPTGTALALRPDPSSTRLTALLASLEPYLLKADPQDPPQGFMDRSLAADPVQLLQAPLWAALREHRDDVAAVPEATWESVSAHRL